MPRKTYFNSSWLQNSDYKTWLSRKDYTTANCKLCNKSIDISNQGESALKRHAQGVNHKQRLPIKTVSSIMDSFAPAEQNEFVQVKNDGGSIEVAKKQASISEMIEKDCVIDAEIRWCLYVAQKKQSQRSCDEVVPLFAVMFPDSEIPGKMSLKKDKCGYVIKHGIAPYFESVLLSEVALSPYYAFSFDESLNKKLQKGQMDIHVRLWNSADEKAETRYLTSEFLGGAKADQILSAFESGVTQMFSETENLLQIGSDGPNVNLLFLKNYNEKRSFNDLSHLLNIGTCGLHTIHGSLKAGEKSSMWCIGKTLKAMSNVLTDTPARRDMFQKVTESNQFPLPYCGHRWCENENCLERADKIWPRYIKFIKYLQKLPKRQQPGQGEGKQFLLLTKKILDPLVQAKMKFMEFLAHKLNTFLRGFQTDQPMVPFLCETLEDLARSILGMFVKNETLREADTVLKFIKLDVTDRAIFKQAVDVGMGAALHISTYKKSPSVKQHKVTQFYTDAQKLLSAIMAHMLEKSPLEYPLARYAASP